LVLVEDIFSDRFRHVQPNRGPHKKGAPQKEQHIFCMPELPKIMGDPRVNASDEQKKVASFFRGKNR